MSVSADPKKPTINHRREQGRCVERGLRSEISSSPYAYAAGGALVNVNVLLYVPALASPGMIAVSD
jgi:hypothetical protein